MARKTSRQNEKQDLRMSSTEHVSQVSPMQIKDKVTAVRGVVPNKSKNEIILVLQYYDYDVTLAIAAYCEDGAKKALTEWNYSGNKPANKKKRKGKNKANETNGSRSSGTSPARIVAPEIEHVEHVASSAKLVHPSNEVSLSAPSPSVNSLAQSSISSTAAKSTNKAESSPSRQSKSSPLPSKNSKQAAKKRKAAVNRRDLRDSSLSEGINSLNYTGNFGLSKSAKDLQRQTTSLSRLKLMLNEEMQRSYKHIKKVFEDMHKLLSEREADILYQMDKVEVQATTTLTLRQEKALNLKRSLEQAQSMSEKQISNLRSEIKQFVSDRKVDEDISQTTRFSCNGAEFASYIMTFGQVTSVSNQYSPDVEMPKVSVTPYNYKPTAYYDITETPKAPQMNDVADKAVSKMLNIEEDEATEVNATLTPEILEIQKKFQDAFKLQGDLEERCPSQNGSAFFRRSRPPRPKTLRSSPPSASEKNDNSRRLPRNSGTGKMARDYNNDTSKRAGKARGVRGGSKPSNKADNSSPGKPPHTVVGMENIKNKKVSSQRISSNESSPKRPVLVGEMKAGPSKKENMGRGDSSGVGNFHRKKVPENKEGSGEGEGKKGGDGSAKSVTSGLPQRQQRNRKVVSNKPASDASLVNGLVNGDTRPMVNGTA